MAAKKEPENPEINQMQEMIAKMLEEAKAEAAKIVEEARAAAKGEMTEEQKNRLEQVNASGEEYVDVKLFKDNGKYKGDVLVCVNGERFLIKRGVRVEVPRYVALVLEESAKQDTATANLIESESSRYEAEAAALNI